MLHHLRQIVGRNGRLGSMALAAALLIFNHGLVVAQTGAYPEKTIRLVVPFPPGGAVDIVGRAIADGLERALKVSVVVENRAGASAMIGSDMVAKASPDGYTLLMGSMSSLAVNTSLFKKTITYDPIKDFEPVVLVGHTQGVLAVNPKVPATTVAELVALAKSKPGVMSYASSGNGNFQHLIGELFKRASGVNILHVPYKGSAPALADVIGGHVDMIFDVVPSAAPQIHAGNLRGLAVTGIERTRVLPNIPTLNESELPGFNVTSWYGLVAPAGTPDEIVRRINSEVLRILKTPELQERFNKIGASILGGSPSDFGVFLKSEIARWGELIRSNNISAE